MAAAGIIALATLAGGCAVPREAKPTFANSLGMIMVRLAAGEFVMGSSRGEADLQRAKMAAKGIASWYPDSPASEAPPRRTRIGRSVYLSARETTLADFRQFVEATGYRTDAERDGRGGDGKVEGRWETRPEFNWREMGHELGVNLPVVNITWNDAAAFCEWLSRKEARTYRLPTEAEWEYACRAGTATRFFWGDDEARRDEYAWSGANSGGGPHQVGELKPNAWGLYDMLGNVYEYCQDYFAPRPYDPEQVVSPTGPTAGTERVVRGGSWGTDPMHLRCAFRGGAGPEHRTRRDGFRIACEAE